MKTSGTMNNVQKLILSIIISCLSLCGFAQTSPIYVAPSLTPPYSLTLSDYTQLGSQRLVVTIMVNDVNISNLPVRLHLKMETTAGVTIENIPTINTAPIYLNGGQVLVLFGDDLADYFNINNLQFKGYSKEEYRRTGQLPEGFYRFTVEIRHAITGRLISNQGNTMAWIALGKPPVLKIPAEGEELGQIPGMPLTFSWIPSAIGIPNIAQQYTLEIWEMRIPGISPYVIAASMPAFYETTQMNNTLVIHPASLFLEPGMQYAWRVTASDLLGQVTFAEKGQSEVRTFTYQSVCDCVTNFTIDQRGKNATLRWENEPNHTSFYVEMENPETGWSNRQVVFDNRMELRDLEPGKKYNIRVQAVCNSNEENASDFTEWKTLVIPENRPVETDCPECGCDTQFPQKEITNFTLRDNLQPGDTIVTPDGSTRYILKTVEPQGNGVYKGIFLFWWEYYRVKIICEYWDLSVNTDNVIVNYDFKSVYNPQFLLDVDAATEYIDNLTETISKGLTDNKEKDIQKLDFAIPNNPVADYNEETGKLVIYSENGEIAGTIDGENGFPAIVEDKDGNRYELDEKGDIAPLNPDISPDYALGEWDKYAYIAKLKNSIDLDAIDGEKITKGHSRNYFVVDETIDAYITLQIDSNRYQRDYKCRWYIDSLCINPDELQSELVLNKKAGAYKIEARRNDTLLLTLTAVFIDAPEIIFKTNSTYDGEYGFDDNLFDDIAVKNEHQELEGLSKYRIPFMSLPVGEKATIEANLMMDKRNLTKEDLENIEIQFTSSFGLSISKKNLLANSLGGLRVKLSEFKDNKLDIDVFSNSINENANISAYIGGNIAGKVLVESKEKLPTSQLIIVKVVINNNIGKNIDLNSVVREVDVLLNKRSYNQGFVQWEIKTDTFHVKLDSLNSLEDVLPELRPLYRKKKNTYVMFIAEVGGASGYGYPYNIDQYFYSVISTYKDNEKTYVHELGHNHGFLDLGVEFKNIFFDTQNFMDYTRQKRNMFWKHQWKEIYEIHKRHKEK